MRRKGIEWWSKEIGIVIERKKECFLVWRGKRSEKDLEEYRKMKRMVKRVNLEWTLSIAENFKAN